MDKVGDEYDAIPDVVGALKDRNPGLRVEASKGRDSHLYIIDIEPQERAGVQMLVTMYFNGLMDIEVEGRLVVEELQLPEEPAAQAKEAVDRIERIGRGGWMEARRGGLRGLFYPLVYGTPDELAARFKGENLRVVRRFGPWGQTK